MEQQPPEPKEEHINIHIPKFNTQTISTVLLIVLIMLIVIIGYIYGAANTCKQLDGWLDNHFKCILDWRQKSVDPFGNIAPNITLIGVR